MEGEKYYQVSFVNGRKAAYIIGKFFAPSIETLKGGISISNGTSIQKILISMDIDFELRMNFAFLNLGRLHNLLL